MTARRWVLLASMVSALGASVFAQTGGLTINQSFIPDAYSGRVYPAYSSSTLTATGGTGPLTWSFVSGNVPLPPWLKIDPASGVLFGTPLASDANTFTSITVRVQQSAPIFAQKTFSLAVRPDLVITSGAPPNTTAGASYPSFSFTATGGLMDGPSAWSISAPSGLSGLTFSSSGTFSPGSTTTAGSFPFTVTVADLNGVATSRNGSLNVLGITTASPLATGSVGLPYSQSIALGNAFADPVTWSFTGTLPAGLSFLNGQITGTPTAASLSTFQVTATDASGSPVTSASKAFSLTVNPALVISPVTLPAGTLNLPYSATLTAALSKVPLVWAVISGTPPVGLILSSSTGIISGTPTAAGTPFTVRVLDASGAGGTATYSIVINATVTPLAVSTTSLPPATIGTLYGAPLSATGGTLPYVNWIVSSGTLPAGLALNAATGVISGTPTAPAVTSSFKVQVQDSATPAATTATSTTLTLTVNAAGAPLSITTTTLPVGTLNTTYTGVTLAATGGTSPYSWNVSTGTLPAGLALNASTGAISGTPTASGSFPLTIQVTDSAATPARAAANFTLVINNSATPLSVTITPTGTQGPAQQPATTVTLGSAASQPISGTLTLTFISAVGPDDPLIKFSNGSRTVPFTIPAGGTQGSFGSSGVSILTGTTAGTITITAALAGGDGTNLTPIPAPSTTIVIAKVVPVITKLTFNSISAGGGSFTVSATGYSTTREVKTAIYHFQAAAGTTLSQPDVTVDVSSAFTTWYASSASNPFGTQFTVTVPFTFSGPLPISTLTMDLTNSIGTSAHASPN